MGDSRVAAGIDRLPWLADEPAPRPIQPRRGARDLTGWGVAAVVIVAASSFWLGMRSEPGEAPPQATVSQPTTTAVLPQAIVPEPQVQIAPQPEVAAGPQPQVREAPQPQVHIAPPQQKAILAQMTKPQASTSQAEQSAEPARKPAPAGTAAPAPAKANHAARLTPWQPRVTAGAAGRLVEIGAFGSVAQAKQGWRYMARSYPAVGRLPAVVRPDRNSKGRVFYRFRVGTTSQAHSEVLCQRMQKIRLSCAVVGLPWKPKVER
jgi:outer membrane biosynthesis protein TonB